MTKSHHLRKYYKVNDSSAQLIFRQQTIIIFFSRNCQFFSLAKKLDKEAFTNTVSLWELKTVFLPDLEYEYTVSQKSSPFYFCDYSVKCSPILIILGSTAAEKICKQMVYFFFIVSSLCMNITR